MVGDAAQPFSIQSVSKPFIFALICDALGAEEAAARLGVDATGLPFNSIMAMELRADGTSNPLVNAGAIAATSLVPGTDAEDRWDQVRQGLSRFAGRELECDARVYASEAATNQRNAGLAHLLRGHGRLYCDPDEAVDVYTRQCALLVSARDLALMGATLASGGRPSSDGRAGRQGLDMSACTGGHGDSGSVRALGELAVRRGPARQERRQWGHPDDRTRQRRSGDIFAPTGCRRQQCAWSAGHAVPVRASGSQLVHFRACGP
ncbi:Glutaminase [Cupriavidus sp. U2]|nr:Glutaminase [Cupriavidus sp. U2]